MLLRSAVQSGDSPHTSSSYIDSNSSVETSSLSTQQATYKTEELKTPSMAALFVHPSASVHSYASNALGFQTCLAQQKKERYSTFRKLLLSVKGKRKDKESTSPQRADESKIYLDESYTNERIIDRDLNALVQIPTGLDSDEWLATHSIAFFQHVNALYGTLSEFCSLDVCTTMTAPNNTQYQWLDERGKKLKCAAPHYVDYVMSYTQRLLEDETIFPTKYGQVFPPGFEMTVRKIHRLLFHVLAHIYAAHYKQVVALHLHSHLNTVFLHFMSFNKHHSLLEPKDCEVLNDLLSKLESQPEIALVEPTADSSGAWPYQPASDDKENLLTGRMDYSSSAQHTPNSSVSKPLVESANIDCKVTPVT